MVESTCIYASTWLRKLGAHRAAGEFIGDKRANGPITKCSTDCADLADYPPRRALFGVIIMDALADICSSMVFDFFADFIGAIVGFSFFYISSHR